jgi:hypothetical protein
MSCNMHAPRIFRLATLAALLQLSATTAAPPDARPPLPPNTIYADQAQGVTFGPAIPVSKSAYAEYPAIALVGGRVHLAWVENIDGVDRVMLAHREDDRLSASGPVSDDGGHACWPALASTPDGKFWAVWSAKSDGRWSIEARCFTGDTPMFMSLPPSDADRFRPAVAATNDDDLFIVWEEVLGNTSKIVLDQPDGQGNKHTTISGPGLAFRPAIATNGRDIWAAWDEIVDDAQHEVFIRRIAPKLDSEPTRVTRHPAIDAAADIQVDDAGRVWVAFHSDRTPDGQWDIPRWSYVRCLQDGKWFAPRDSIPGRQDDPRGEDQGLEFPTLALDGSGGLWTFGRPSQGFTAARYTGDDWAPAYRFSNPGWGGRGQQVRCVADGNAIWTVRRDVQRLLLQRIDVEPATDAALTLEPVSEPYPGEVPRPVPPPGYFPAPTAKAEVEGYRVLFGDVHMHSSLSDGTGSPDEIYIRARESYKYDFAVMTDHDDFTGNRILPSEWDQMKAITNLFNGPRNFTTLVGFEWTDARHPQGDGHKNVYYRDDGPMIWHTNPETGDSATLFPLLRKLNGICFPHHIGWTGVDWAAHDHVAQPNVEITSVHGAYEYMGNLPIKHRGGMRGHFVRDGLGLGKRFGLVGGSDAHGLAWHHGIARRRNPWTHGLTGVLVTSATREAIWDALAARRCYATSGPKIVIDFRVSGTVMGDELTLPAETRPEIRARVDAGSRLQYASVVRDGEEILHSGGDVDSAVIRFVDGEISHSHSRGEEAAHAHAGDADHGGYYYLRVVLENGEMAWSSPVFIRRPADASP